MLGEWCGKCLAKPLTELAAPPILTQKSSCSIPFGNGKQTATISNNKCHMEQQRSTHIVVCTHQHWPDTQQLPNKWQLLLYNWHGVCTICWSTTQTGAHLSNIWLERHAETFCVNHCNPLEWEAWQSLLCSKVYIGCLSVACARCRVIFLLRLWCCWSNTLGVRYGEGSNKLHPTYAYLLRRVLHQSKVFTADLFFTALDFGRWSRWTQRRSQKP